MSMHYRHLLAMICVAILAGISPSAVLGLGTPAGTVIAESCTLRYSAGGTASSAMAVTSTTVAQTAAVALMPGAVPTTIVPGQAYYIPVTATNAGNGSDTFSLSAASAHNWPVQFVRDDNNDGIHQGTEISIITSTSALAPDNAASCFACVTVPTTATSGDAVTLKATSALLTTASAGATLTFPVPAVHSVAFSQAPAVSPTAVVSGGVTNCTAAAADSLGHSVIYNWSDGGAGGTFAPSSSVQDPTYTAPQNSTATDTVVTVTCTASCSQSSTVAVSASASLTVHPVVPPPAPHSVTFTQALAISPTAVASGGNTSCNAMAVDSLEHSVTYKWSDGGVGGTFAPSASAQSPVYSAPKNSSAADIVVTLTCNAACSQNAAVTISASAPLTVHPDAPPVPVSIPGDFNRDGVVNSLDMSLFNQEWARWHPTKPMFLAGVDAICDLAPRGFGIWPNWTPIGDKAINIQDATAFVECYLKSKSSTGSYATTAQMYRTTSLIFVSVSSAPCGIYQTSVVLPSGVTFKTTLDGNGNLSRVQRSTGSGSMLYTEYDPATRTIRLTGNVGTGYAPYMIAVIYLN